MYLPMCATPWPWAPPESSWFVTLGGRAAYQACHVCCQSGGRGRNILLPLAVVLTLLVPLQQYFWSIGHCCMHQHVSSTETENDNRE
jgi:fatty acid desaturase